MGLLLALLTGGCTFDGGHVIRGDGNIITLEKDLEEFRSIHFGGTYEAVLIPSGQHYLSLETDGNIQEITEIRVENGILYIRSTEDGAIRPTKMNLYIHFTTLEKIEVGGACRLSSQGALTGERLHIEVSGAADLDFELDVTDLVTKISGAARLDYQGYAQRHRANLSGASSVRAENLHTLETQISLSGAGSAYVHASERLQASLSGAGSIRYYGDPAEVVADRSGLGRIRAAD